MSFPSTIEKFSEAAGMGTISVDQPFLCHLVQIMKSDSEKQFMQVILEDSIHQKLWVFSIRIFSIFSKFNPSISPTDEILQSLKANVLKLLEENI